MALQEIAAEEAAEDVLGIADIGDINYRHLSAERYFWRSPSDTLLHRTLAPFLIDCLDSISKARGSLLSVTEGPRLVARRMALAGLAMGRFVRVTGLIDADSAEAHEADISNVLIDASPADGILQIHIPRTQIQLYAPNLDVKILPSWLTSHDGLYAEVLPSAQVATAQFYEEHAAAFNQPFDPESGVMVRPHLSKAVFTAPPVV